MILLDAYAALAYLADEREAADTVESLLLSGDPVAISSVNAAEVVDCAIRRYGVEQDDAILDVLQLGVEVLAADASVGLAAGVLRARHYRRRPTSVSLADCFAAATALARPGRTLVSSDPALLSMVHAEGGRVRPLPDSGGAMWAPPSPNGA